MMAYQTTAEDPILEWRPTTSKHVHGGSINGVDLIMADFEVEQPGTVIMLAVYNQQSVTNPRLIDFLRQQL